MKLGCPSCKRLLTVAKVGLVVLTRDAHGQPYQLWSVDELVCGGCNFAVHAFADRPFAHAGDDKFEIVMNAAKHRGELREVR